MTLKRYKDDNGLYYWKDLKDKIEEVVEEEKPVEKPKLIKKRKK
jgi:hypothetical protein